MGNILFWPEVQSVPVWGAEFEHMTYLTLTIKTVDMDEITEETRMTKGEDQVRSVPSRGFCKGEGESIARSIMQNHAET